MYINSYFTGEGMCSDQLAHTVQLLETTDPNLSDTCKPLMVTSDICDTVGYVIAST